MATAQDPYRAAIIRAAEMVGGARNLCDLLHVPMAEVTCWLDGTDRPSIGIFLKVVDLIIEESRKPQLHSGERRQADEDRADDS